MPAPLCFAPHSPRYCSRQLALRCCPGCGGSPTSKKTDKEEPKPNPNPNPKENPNPKPKDKDPNKTPIPITPDSTLGRGRRRG